MIILLMFLKNIGIDYNLVLGRCSDSKNQIKKYKNHKK